MLQGGEHKRSNTDGRISRPTHPRLRRGQKDHHPTSNLPPPQHGQFLPSSCHTVLDCGHRYTCTLQKPKISFKGGGTKTMNVIREHHVINMTLIDAHTETPHKITLLHLREPYDPPSFHNNATHTQNTNRPYVNTPTAFIYHLRYGCAGEVVLKRTQEHAIGMQVRKDSWNNLSHLLPCNACIAGKMRKTKKAISSTFTNVKNLALSWTPATANKQTIPNQHISTDWGIINRTSKVGLNNVFALYLDLQTGWTAVYPCPSRGQAERKGGGGP